MSADVLQRLRDATAFKPKPPDLELALAHVPAATVGIPKPIDERVLRAMTTDDETFVIVVGAPGSGKSSLLTAAAREAAQPDKPPHPLPLKVPVSHYASIAPDVLVKAIAQALATELRGSLSDQEVQQLEAALATNIVKTHQPGGISGGSVTAGLPFLSATVSASLGQDLLTLITTPEWQGGGPVPSLLSLRDLAAAHAARLVVIFHDTDVWSVGDGQMAARARNFFSALRVLLDCDEITFLVAVQTHWTETSDGVGPHTSAARAEYRELAARVGVLLKVPQPASNQQARALMVAIINKRVEITLDDTPPAGGWAEALFTSDALELLAHRCRAKSIRQAIADIRDTFDHLAEMPDQISREHLLEAIEP